MNKACHMTCVHQRYDGRIFHKECQSLQKAGYEVHLVVADGKGDEEISGISIYDVGKETNRVNRILVSAKRTYLKALDLNCQIYHIHDPELIPFGLKLKRKGKIVIFDSHEDVPQQIKSKIYIPYFIRLILSRLVERIEKRILPQLDAVISVTPHIVDRLSKINRQTYLITNYPIVSKLDPPCVKQINTVCFTGLVSEIWLHETVLDAIHKIENIKYILAGPADEKYLQKLQKHPAWGKVQYLGVVSYKEVKSIFLRSSIGIALADYLPEVGYDRGTLGNNKIFEYMQAGLPIVCTDFILWKEAVGDTYSGLCVSPKNKDSIADAITYLVEHPEEALKMGLNGQRNVVEKYNWESQEEVLLKIYSKLPNE